VKVDRNTHSYRREGACVLKEFPDLFGADLSLDMDPCDEGNGTVTFCTEMPGRIKHFKLKEGESIICQRDAFMAAESSVDLKMELAKRIGAGFFGGEGFFLQRITGPGNAFIEISGEVTEYDLKEGQALKVDPGYIAAFEPTVDYDISRIKGVKNMLFSGEGFFLATLKGPGKVWLQSMPLANLVKKIASKMPKKG
ncbi:MAG: TIGR00266 family protein, partial [Candidatus Woesearchaeota archaeon]